MSQLAYFTFGKRLARSIRSVFARWQRFWFFWARKIFLTSFTRIPIWCSLKWLIRVLKIFRVVVLAQKLWNYWKKTLLVSPSWTIFRQECPRTWAILAFWTAWTTLLTSEVLKIPTFTILAIIDWPFIDKRLLFWVHNSFNILYLWFHKGII